MYRLQSVRGVRFGRRYSSVNDGSNVVTFEVFRYNRESSTNRSPYIQTYKVNVNECAPMVLDALIKIKNEQDPTLAFRRSCREGVCGSCAMNISGVNGLACLKKIEETIDNGKIRVYPLPHMQIIRDLVPNLSIFYEQHKSIRPWLEPKMNEVIGADKEIYQSRDQRNDLDGLYECILCACCSTSCPSYWWSGEEDYLGPAALLQAYRWVNDSRDSIREDRIKFLADDKLSVFKCHTIMNCTQACPKGLNPAKAIQKLKVQVLKYKPPTKVFKAISQITDDPHVPGVEDKHIGLQERAKKFLDATKSFFD